MKNAVDGYSEYAKTSECPWCKSKATQTKVEIMKIYYMCNANPSHVFTKPTPAGYVAAPAAFLFKLFVRVSS